MKKLLLIDDNPLAEKLLGEILPDDVTVISAPAGVQCEAVLHKEQPKLLLVNTGCKDIFHFLEKLIKQKLTEGCGIVFMGTGEDIKAHMQTIKKFAPLDCIFLPFSPEELEEKVDEAFITVLGMRDEMTGLYKKPCFDGKVQRLMKRKVNGALFSMNLDRLSFASNAINGAELQLCVYAIKHEMSDALLGVNGDEIMGFFPYNGPHSGASERMDKLIATIREAVTDGKVYVSVGLACAEDYDFDYEEAYVDANRALGVARSGGKNCCRFYR